MGAAGQHSCACERLGAQQTRSTHFESPRSVYSLTTLSFCCCVVLCQSHLDKCLGLLQEFKQSKQHKAKPKLSDTIEKAMAEGEDEDEETPKEKEAAEAGREEGEVQVKGPSPQKAGRIGKK